MNLKVINLILPNKVKEKVHNFLQLSGNSVGEFWYKYNLNKFNISELFFSLTLKAPNKNCSGQHFNILLLSFEENKA